MAKRRGRRRSKLSAEQQRHQYNQCGSGRRERKNMPYERRARLDKIRGQPCQAAGCYLPRGTDGSYSGYCKLHHQRMKRWGQPDGRTVLKRELMANVDDAMAFLDRNKNHKSIKTAIIWIDSVLTSARCGARIKGGAHWVRLHEAGVTAQRIFATQIALYLFVRLNRDFDFGRPFRLQLGHCVARLAQMPKVRYWNAQRKCFRSASKPLTTKEREDIGDSLHEKLNRLVIQIVQHMDKVKMQGCL